MGKSDKTDIQELKKAGNNGRLPAEECYEISRQTATEGIVVLKNDGVLPLREKTVALFGAGAVDTIVCGTGSGSVAPPYVINVQQGIEDGGYTITSRRWLDKFAAASKKANDEDTTLSQIDRIWSGQTILIDELPITEEELAEARAAKTAIYVIQRNTGEKYDRENTPGDYQLSLAEEKNLMAIASAFENTVVVFNTTQMDAKFVDHYKGIKAAVYMSLLGMEAGHALCDILFGKVCPSGRLTDTWANSYTDYPAALTFSNHDGCTTQENYHEDIYVGYRYFDSFGIEPKYPFGFGLSYTTFAQTVRSVTADAQQIKVTVSVKNTGRVPGKEVVQVYVSAPQCAELPKPYQELKGFGKTSELNPGACEELVITIPTKSLASYDMAKAAYVLTAGNYLIRVGKHSRDTDVAAVLALDAEVITQQLSNLVCCDRSFGIYKAPPILYEETNAPVLALHAVDFVTENLAKTEETKITTYVAEGSHYTPLSAEALAKSPYPCAEEVVTVRKVPTATLLDVAEGKVTMPEFVASLDTPTLLRLVTGIANETPHPVPNRMTQKVKPFEAPNSSGQTTGQYLESLGIPKTYMTDGPAGLHIIGMPKTGWPVGIPCAQTWNVELIRRVGDGFGKEMRTYHQSVLLGPGMNIHRDPLCGRCFEYYSEDPLVSGKMAAAFTTGVQSNPGCKVSIKHFACNNQETDRATSNASLSERALREIYLKGFEIAVREANPGTIMTAYNCVNGRHCSENKELLNDIVRGEWGYQNLFMTDWGSQSYKPNDMHAGNDLIMGGLQVEFFENALYGGAPQFEPDGSVAEIVNMAYGGMMRQAVENWGAFLPQKEGADSVTTTVAAEVAIGARAQKLLDEGIATLTVQADGSRQITYHGINRGVHLALGDVQKCAMNVLNYLLSSLAWEDMLATMEQ